MLVNHVCFSSIQWDIYKLYGYRTVLRSLRVPTLLLLPIDHCNNQKALTKNSKGLLEGGATPVKKQ